MVPRVTLVSSRLTGSDITWTSESDGANMTVRNEWAGLNIWWAESRWWAQSYLGALECLNYA